MITCKSEIIYNTRCMFIASLILFFGSTALAQDQHLIHEEGEEREHSEESNEIHLGERQLALLNIETAAAEEGSAAALIEAPATVHFNADRIALVGPLLHSRILEVSRDLGDEVERGATLAVLESVELGKVKASFLAAQARLDSRQAEYQRDQRLSQQQVTSEAHLLETRAAYLEAQAELDALIAELRLYGLSREEISAISADSEIPLSRYTLTAPISGVIQSRDLIPGQSVGPDETPIQIVNTNSLWLYIDVFERHLEEMAPQQEVIFSLRISPDRIFRGQTNWISRELDATSRTLRVRATIDNSGQFLRAGMFGTAQILTESDKKLPMISVNAVQNLHEGEQVVFVPGDEPGAYLARPVTSGEEAGGMVEITSGLEAGEMVVVSGAFDLMSALTAGDRSAEHSH